MKISFAHLLLLGTALGLPLQQAARSEECPNGLCVSEGVFERAVEPIPVGGHGDGHGTTTGHGTGKGGSNGGSGGETSNESFIPDEGTTGSGAGHGKTNKSPACKRAGDCTPTADEEYTFGGKDYVAKGKKAYAEAIASTKLNNHDWATVSKKYTIKKVDKQDLTVDSGLKTLFSQQGIKLPHPLAGGGDKSWTKFEVYGAKGEELENMENKQSVMETWVSVTHKAIVRKRAYKNDNSLYGKELPQKDRLPMSEFMWQLWKETVADGKGTYGVEIKEADLEKVFVTDVQNAEAKEIVQRSAKNLADGKTVFEIPAGKPANDAIKYSSMGHALVYTLKDHNVEGQLNKMKIKSIHMQEKDNGGDPAGVFVMGH